MTTREIAFVDSVFAGLGRASIAQADHQYIYPDPVEFIETEFYIPETGKPVVLTEHQRRVIRAAFERRDGQFLYSTIIYSSTKKSGKTTLAGALALWHGFQISYGHIYLIGHDLRQADSRAAEAIRFAVQAHPNWRNTVKVKPSGYQVRLPNGTLIEAIPVDPHGEAGMNPSAIFWTEAWGVRHDAGLKLWTETTLSPTQFGQSFRFVESYAGYAGESPLLERLYETGVKEGRRLDNEIEMYVNESASMFAYWNTTYRAPWQTDAYYAQQAADLTPSEFQRVHRNQWVTSENVFVQPEWWEACRGDMPAFTPDTPVIVGMDAGVSNDCFALVGVSRIGEMVYVRFVRIYRPPKGGTINFDEIERYIREELVKTYHVQQIAYDPTQLHQMASRLTRDGVVWMYEFKQGEPRAVADKQLYDSIMYRHIVHDGNHELTEHVIHANSKADAQEHSLRIIKRADHLKIDAAVALSMANHEARRLNVG